MMKNTNTNKKTTTMSLGTYAVRHGHYREIRETRYSTSLHSLVPTACKYNTTTGGVVEGVTGKTKGEGRKGKKFRRKFVIKAVRQTAW